MEIKRICKNCDFICENKIKGVFCWNPKSEKQNQNINEDDEACEFMETNYYITPKNKDDLDLFEVVN